LPSSITMPKIKESRIAKYASRISAPRTLLSVARTLLCVFSPLLSLFRPLVESCMSCLAVPAVSEAANE